MGFWEDRRPTLASWPKRIYDWQELPAPFRPALEEWIAGGMPPGNATYIPKLRQGSWAEEYAAAWWGDEVLLQALERRQVRQARLRGGGLSVEYQVQLLKCTVTVHGGEGGPFAFSYNKVKEDQLAPVLSLLLGQPPLRPFPTAHPDPGGMRWLLEDSYGMYHICLLCYRLGDRLEDCLWLRHPRARLLPGGGKAECPEYFLARTGRGLAALSHDSHATRVLYAPWGSGPTLKLAGEGRRRALVLQAATGGALSVPLLPGQEDRAGEFLKRNSGYER